MSRQQFFNKKHQFLTLKQVIEITKAEIDLEIDQNLEIHDVSTLDKAKNNEISFINSPQYKENLANSKAGFCFMEQKYVANIAPNITPLICKNPYFAYSQIASSFYEEKPAKFDNNLIDPTATIGKGSQIAANAFIGANVKIGKNCVIGPAASIMNDCEIGDNTIINAGATIAFAKIGNDCIIYSGARIGQDGFGFAYDSGVNHKIIQLGIVQIGNSVEIGANSCVDRGAICNTTISNGVKIDNITQVGHNVEIGQGTVISGCTAIAGSAKIGNFVQIGGGTGIAGHLTIGDGAKIAARSGVMRTINPGQVVGGFPAIDIRKWHKINSTLIRMANSKKI